MTDKINFDRLNSATKYPSIPTYHALDGRGNLVENAAEVYPPGEPVFAREKVDGTNARIVVFPDGDYVIGAREHLLHARGDRYINPENGVVETLLPIAERLGPDPDGGDHILTFFLEVYGGTVGKAARQYTGNKALGARLFDIAVTPTYVLDSSVEAISAWRKSGGQRWFTEAGLERAAEFNKIDLAPRIDVISADDCLPTTLANMHAYMSTVLSTTRVRLDDDGRGEPEGLVLRTADRRVITKARFEDYHKVLFPQPQRKPRPQREQTAS